MGVSLIFVGVRQQNGCFDTHTFIQFSTYDHVTSKSSHFFGATLYSLQTLGQYTYVNLLRVVLRKFEIPLFPNFFKMG